MCLYLWTNTAQATSVDQKWKTITTEHFHIHYYVGNEDAAARIAMVTERAHDRLSQILGHTPRYLKTHIIVNDHTDSANGSATPSPFPRINAYVTAPESMSVLEAYDDWLDILMTHELVHVYHLDTVHGLPRLVNAILGLGVHNIWPPNVIQPRWVIEGLATHFESSLGSQGRGRSAQFEMMLRMGVLEQGFQPIDMVTNGAKIFPHGSGVYLYGGRLMHYIAARYGEDKLRELSHVYASTLIPLAINRTVEEVLGVTYEQLWKEFELHLTREYQAQARRIRARGIREGRRITFGTASSASANFNRHPFWSADDSEIFFFRDTGHRLPGIHRVKSTGSRIREGIGIGREGMDPDIKKVFQIQNASSGSFVGATPDMVFEMTRTHDFRYNWDDLYRWHGPNPNNVERLTFGLRAHDPHVSPDGRTVVFSRNDSAQARLAFLELDTLKVTEVKPLERFFQATTPRWAPDSRRVVYSGWRDGGYRDIYIYDRDSEQTTRITADRYLDTEPSWSPDGEYIVFASDRNQVANIYAYELATGKVHQVTNVIGGAFEPVISHDGRRMVYVGYRKDGFDLWVMKFDPTQFLKPLPSPRPSPLKSDPTPELEIDKGRHPALRSKRYQPGKTFFPRTITPGLAAFGSGGLGADIELATAFSDVLGFHVLGGNFGYLFSYGQPLGGVTYSYRQLLPSFTIGYSRQFALRNGFERFNYDHAFGADNPDVPGFRQTGYRELIDEFGISTGLPILRHPLHQADLGIGYSYVHYRNLDAQDEVIDPNLPVSELPEVGGLGQISMTLSYSSLQSFRYGYGSEWGRRAAFTMTVIDPALGGKFWDLQLRGSYTEKLRMPWRGHQALALRLEGGVSAGGFDRRSPFFIGGQGTGQDLLRTIIARTSANESGKLRGFVPSAFSGRYFMVLNNEYVIPLYDVERGIGSLPLFMDRLLLVPFADVGMAWTEELTKELIKVGVGASMIFAFDIGYGGEAVNLYFTYAHGFDPEFGVDTFQVMIANRF